MPRVRICRERLNLPYVDGYEAYAVFNTADKTLTFFRDRAGKYTNGQVIGTKTYYAGFENRTGTYVPWASINSQAESVYFEDVIEPLQMIEWFKGMNINAIHNIELLSDKKIESMSNAFQETTIESNLDLSHFTGEALHYMRATFLQANIPNIDLSGLVASNLEDMRQTFYLARNTSTIDLSKLNTQNVNDFRWTFYGCEKCTTIYASDAFVVNTTSNLMFQWDTLLVGGAGTTYSVYDQTYARIDNPPDNPGYFTEKGE